MKDASKERVVALVQLVLREVTLNKRAVGLANVVPHKGSAMGCAAGWVRFHSTGLGVKTCSQAVRGWRMSAGSWQT